MEPPEIPLETPETLLALAREAFFDLGAPDAPSAADFDFFVRNAQRIAREVRVKREPEASAGDSSVAAIKQRKLPELPSRSQREV
jgi:hypothetical protein